MPIILATQEAEIRKTEIQSQRGEKSSRDPILNAKKKGWWSGSSGRMPA
jgi:hypothetical protein